MPYFEDYEHGVGVAYYRAELPNSPAAWAELFGRRTINAMIANQPIQDIEYYARLAGSYATIALRQREREPAADMRHGNVHPVMRDMVNSVAAAHGIPAPKMEEEDQ